MLLARATAVAAACLACWMPAQAANGPTTTLDFNSLQAGDYRGSLSLGGFVLDPGALGTSDTGWAGHYHIAAPTEPTWLANNGSNFFVFDYFLDNSVLNIYSAQNELFGLQSLDLGVASASMTSCATRNFDYELSFNGVLASGATVSTSRTLRMQCDGSGPLDDFETLAFGSEWNSLQSLTIQQVRFSDIPDSNIALDNLVLSAAPIVAPVPEPESYAMLGLGLLGVAWQVRRERRKRSA